MRLTLLSNVVTSCPLLGFYKAFVLGLTRATYGEITDRTSSHVQVCAPMFDSLQLIWFKLDCVDAESSPVNSCKSEKFSGPPVLC